MTGRVAIPGFGALVEPTGVRFRVWTPDVQKVTLVHDGGEQPLDSVGEGYFSTFVEGMQPGARYRYRLEDRPPFPDPASRFQPEGVHGPSQVVNPAAYRWGDAGWAGLDQRELVFYELHVGTFSPEGNYDGVRKRLLYLKELGITAIELMPLADFPGRWNWGYDPAALWAPSRAYGQPDDLRALIDEAHQLGMAVFLDVIYNHLGPDGAYVGAYGPFFTDKHHTPWGQAINLDGRDCHGVRAFFLGNALHWLTEYHFDGLRLDATFALVDDSPKHFLAELSEHVAALPGPRRYLIAEDHRNLNRLVQPLEQGGYGLHGAWSDDFHHLVRRLVAGDSHGYYSTFPASAEALARAIEQGWYFTGQQPENGGEPRGTPTHGLGKEQFVFFIQNHDQVGNRARGDRLHHRIDLPLYRATSALLLFLPELPLLFMGQEWATSAPFQYFTDHNAELGKLVSEGRRREFALFPEFAGEVPDPQEPATFERSKLDWAELDDKPHSGILALYRDLLARRRELAGEAGAGGSVAEIQALSPTSGGIVLRRGRQVLLVALEAGVALPMAFLRPGQARMVWHSEDERYTELPKPPRIQGNSVVFEVPSAILFGEE